VISRDALARELVITVEDGAAARFGSVLAALAAYRARSVTEWTIGEPPTRRLVRVYRLVDVPPPDLIASLNAGGVRVERNVAMRRAAVAIRDPLYREQWALARMSVEAAWQCLVTTPAPSPVTVAVIDSGIATTHPDLAARVHPASRRFIDAVPDNRIGDEDGHGTYLAGTIAAITNNGVGVASAPGPLPIRILALKFYDPFTPLNGANAARAIVYAVDHGARVVNASWHVGVENPLLLTAIEYAAQNDVLFVAAAGNEGTNNDVSPVWPASHALPNVVSVMASNRHDDKPGFSNYGPTTVHVAAPGTAILSTHHYWRAPQYRDYAGTSAAAAHVAAAAAIVRSLRPAMTAAAVRAHLIASVDRSRYLRCIAGGRLNLERVVCGLP
jgi:subtilisin family serine protease